MSVVTMHFDDLMELQKNYQEALLLISLMSKEMDMKGKEKVESFLEGKKNGKLQRDIQSTLVVRRQ